MKLHYWPQQKTHAFVSSCCRLTVINISINISDAPQEWVSTHRQDLLDSKKFGEFHTQPPQETNTYNHPMRKVKQQKQESILMFCLDNFHYIFHIIIARE